MASKSGLPLAPFAAAISTSTVLAESARREQQFAISLPVLFRAGRTDTFETFLNRAGALVRGKNAFAARDEGPDCGFHLQVEHKVKPI